MTIDIYMKKYGELVMKDITSYSDDKLLELLRYVQNDIHKIESETELRDFKGLKDIELVVAPYEQTGKVSFKEDPSQFLSFMDRVVKIYQDDSYFISSTHNNDTLYSALNEYMNSSECITKFSQFLLNLVEFYELLKRREKLLNQLKQKEKEIKNLLKIQ